MEYISSILDSGSILENTIGGVFSVLVIWLITIIFKPVIEIISSYFLVKELRRARTNIVKMPYNLGIYINPFSQKKLKNKVILLGEPGSGKTSFLKRQEINCNKNKKTTVYLHASDFEVSFEETICLSVLSIDKNSKQYEKTKNILSKLIKKGKITILLDSIENITSSRKKEILVNSISELFSLQSSKLIVSCRTENFELSYRHSFFWNNMEKNLEEVSIPKFDEIDIFDFIEQALESIDDKKEHTKELISFISKNEDIKKIISNPLLLNLFIIVYINNKNILELPTSIVEFYDKAIKAFIDPKRVPIDKALINGNDFLINDDRNYILNIIYHISYHYTNYIDRLKDEMYLKSVITDFFTQENLHIPTLEAIELLSSFIINTGIIYHENHDSENKLIYYHDSFREYLSAKYLVRKNKDVISIYQQSPEQWLNIIKFFGLVSKDKSQGLELLRHEIKENIENAILLIDSNNRKLLSLPEQKEFIYNLKNKIDSRLCIVNYKILGSISHTSDFIGNEVYSIIQEHFLKERERKDIMNIASGLVLASKLNTVELLYDKQCYEEIIKMGNSAIPGVRKLFALKYQEKDSTIKPLLALSKILVSINTVESVRVLLDIIFSDQHPHYIAPYISEIIFERKFERILNIVEQHYTISNYTSSHFEWVSTPFNKQISSLHSKTLIKTFELLTEKQNLFYPEDYSLKNKKNGQETNTKLDEFILFNPDIKIMIPLCMIHLWKDSRITYGVKRNLAITLHTRNSYDGGLIDRVEKELEYLKVSENWLYFFKKYIAENYKIDLLSRISRLDYSGSINEWNVFILEKEKYKFSTGWHYKYIKHIILLPTFLSIPIAFYLLIHIEHPFVIFSIIVVIFTILLSWVSYMRDPFNYENNKYITATLISTVIINSCYSWITIGFLGRIVLVIEAFNSILGKKSLDMEKILLNTIPVITWSLGLIFLSVLFLLKILLFDGVIILFVVIVLLFLFIVIIYSLFKSGKKKEYDSNQPLAGVLIPSANSGQ